jgi:hypothetical protein
MIIVNNHYVDLKVCNKEEISILNKFKICHHNKLGYECTFFMIFWLLVPNLECILGIQEECE